MRRFGTEEVSDYHENNQGTRIGVPCSSAIPLLSMVWVLRPSILPMVRILHLALVSGLEEKRRVSDTLVFPFFCYESIPQHEPRALVVLVLGRVMRIGLFADLPPVSSNLDLSGHNHPIPNDPAPEPLRP
jgi:hypothetical protein